VSAVATLPKLPKRYAAPEPWTRTPEQEKLVHDHLRQVKRLYKEKDVGPELMRLLNDPTILGTPESVQFLGYADGTRLFQLYSNYWKLAEDDQVPHPSGFPEPDAFGPNRGPRPVRGIMLGRVALWAILSGRLFWDFAAEDIERQKGINHGGAPKAS
jgi:hypothetical protein